MTIAENIERAARVVMAAPASMIKANGIIGITGYGVPTVQVRDTDAATEWGGYLIGFDDITVSDSHGVRTVTGECWDAYAGETFTLAITWVREVRTPDDCTHRWVTYLEPESDWGPAHERQYCANVCGARS